MVWLEWMILEDIAILFCGYNRRMTEGCCCWFASVVSDSVRPHRRQPTRLPRPWDFPGKNTGVACHLLLQCRKVKSECEVTEPCPTLCDLRDCSLPGSSVHGIFQARVLEWGAIAFSVTEGYGNTFEKEVSFLRKRKISELK